MREPRLWAGALALSLATFADGAPVESVAQDPAAHAAYCIAVTEWRIHSMQSLIALPESGLDAEAKGELQAKAAEAKTLLDRLQRYLEPRRERLEPAVNAGAKRLGESDAAVFVQRSLEAGMRCEASCEAGRARDPHDCREACMAKDEVLRRFRSCADDRFLKSDGG
jgi:hypothetical protein